MRYLALLALLLDVQQSRALLCSPPMAQTPQLVSLPQLGGKECANRAGIFLNLLCRYRGHTR